MQWQREMIVVFFFLLSTYLIMHLIIMNYYTRDIQLCDDETGNKKTMKIVWLYCEGGVCTRLPVI